MAESRVADRSELLSHQGAAFLLARRIAGSAADAEDIVQEAYLRAVRFEGEIPEGVEGRQWFLRVVANTAKSLRASQGSRTRRERIAGMERVGQAGCGPREANEREELRNSVFQALEHLDEELRVSLSLHYEQGFSYVEVSKLLGVPEGTLRSQVSRGLKLLRERLAGAGLEAPLPAIAAVLGSGTIPPVPPALSAALSALVAQGSVPSAASSAAPATLPHLAGQAGVKFAWVAGMVLAGAAAWWWFKPPPVTVVPAVVPQAKPKEAAAPPAEAPVPAAVPTQPIPADLERILSQRFDPVYRRDYPCEVLADLQAEFALPSALPAGLEYACLVSLERRDVSVKEVLEHLAKTGGFELDFRTARRPPPDRSAGDPKSAKLPPSEGQQDETLAAPNSPMGVVVLWKKAGAKEREDLLALLKSDVPEVRRKAAFDLARLSDLSVLPILFELMHSKDPAMVMGLADTLIREHPATLRFGEHIGSAVEALLARTTSPGDVQSMLTFLALSGDAQALKKLEDLSAAGTNSEDPFAPSVPRALEMARLFFGRAPELARKAYLRSYPLRPSRDPVEVQKLVQLLKEAPNPGPPPNVLPERLRTDPAFRDDYVSELKESNSALINRVEAIGRLGRSRDPQAFTALIERWSLLRFRNGLEGGAVAEAMAEYREAGALAQLVRGLALLPDNAHQLLSKVYDAPKGPELVQVFLDLLKDRDPAVRLEAAYALLHGQGLRKAFQPDPREVVALRAAAAAALQSKEAAIRQRCAKVLSKVRDHDAVKLLSLLAGDADPYVREAAAYNLGECRLPEAADALLLLARDPVYFVRIHAHNGLKKVLDLLPKDAPQRIHAEEILSQSSKRGSRPRGEHPEAGHAVQDSTRLPEHEDF